MLLRDSPGIQLKPTCIHISQLFCLEPTPKPGIPALSPLPDGTSVGEQHISMPIYNMTTSICYSKDSTNFSFPLFPPHILDLKCKR